MKKITITLFLAIIVFALIFGIRNCTKTKLFNDLESKAQILDSSLNNENLQNYEQFKKEVNEYLDSVSSTLGRRGIIFGHYLSATDKEIILDNAFKRLFTLKEVLFNNENFFRYTVFLTWEKIKNKFLSSLETVCLKNNDKDLSEMIDKRQANGMIAQLDITAEDEKIRNQKIPDPQYRQSWVVKKTTREIIKDIRKRAKKELPPGTKDVSAPEQKWVTTTTRTPIGINEIHNRRGEKLHFVMKNRREYDGEIEKVDDRFVHLKMKMAGGAMRTKILKSEIKTVEKVTVESKYVIVEPKKGAVSKTETAGEIKNYVYNEMLYHPSMIDNKVVFITKRLRMYFISEYSGKLICHSRTTLDEFKPVATKLKDSWYRDALIKAEYAVDKRDYNPVMKVLNLRLRDFEWLNPKERTGRLTSEARSRFSMESKNIDKIIAFRNFKLNFVIKLTGVPIRRGDPAVRTTALRLLTNNLVLICHSRYLDRALYQFGKARYGHGELPWEFEVVKTSEE